MSFSFFQPIQDGFVLLNRRGAYLQADLYARGSRLYAKVGRSFYRLDTAGSTSSTSMSWYEVTGGDALIEMRNGAAPLFLGLREPPRVIEAAE